MNNKIFPGFKFYDVIIIIFPIIPILGFHWFWEVLCEISTLFHFEFLKTRLICVAHIIYLSKNPNRMKKIQILQAERSFSWIVRFRVFQRKWWRHMKSADVSKILVPSFFYLMVYYKSAKFQLKSIKGSGVTEGGGGIRPPP